MPEGPEVKIASDYLNNHFESNKKINFEIITDYYKNKYLDVFTVIKNYLNVFTQSYTIGKNIFINLDKNKIFNFHLGMTVYILYKIPKNMEITRLLLPITLFSSKYET